MIAQSQQFPWIQSPKSKYQKTSTSTGAKNWSQIEKIKPPSAAIRATNSIHGKVLCLIFQRQILKMPLSTILETGNHAQSWDWTPQKEIQRFLVIINCRKNILNKPSTCKQSRTTTKSKTTTNGMTLVRTDIRIPSKTFFSFRNHQTPCQKNNSLICPFVSISQEPKLYPIRSNANPSNNKPHFLKELLHIYKKATIPKKVWGVQNPSYTHLNSLYAAKPINEMNPFHQNTKTPQNETDELRKKDQGCEKWLSTLILTFGLKGLLLRIWVVWSKIQQNQLLRTMLLNLAGWIPPKNKTRCPVIFTQTHLQVFTNRKTRVIVIVLFSFFYLKLSCKTCDLETFYWNI